MKNLVVFLGCILCFTACEDIKIDKNSLPQSTGKYGEVVVVVDTLYENRLTGEALEHIFYEALEGMPQEETQFRMSTVSPKGFKSILKRSRNILNLNIRKGKKTDIRIERNIWAKNQFMIHITADSDEAAARILNRNFETIRNYFNEEEISRLQRQFNHKPEKDLMADLREEYNINITVPPGFVRMASDEKGFWLKKEKSVGEHQILQGISFYTYPYESDSVFEVNEMMNKRDIFTQKSIQGTLDSSYMAVYREYNPVLREINFNNHYSKEYRGLWNMKNDFMGGPFLHYTMVDEKNNRVINLDAFVYAPKFSKREYLRELEAILKTVKL